ncbi:MAG: threonine ammonia-lyase [Deltaproteobacteria bacterium]|nr:threonine ammonia-lyase [Deltaproteobacteria bacterium]PWB64251.1 MAG: threonine ammonia-lyase [Deltaproteobacteria bacterium]
MDFGRKDVLAARERVYRLAYPTPLVEEDPLSERFGGKVLSKLENLQVSGSFKIRGAANKVLSLDPLAVRGVIAASAGNHARGVARAARAAGIPATLVMPVWAPVSKAAAAERDGGETTRVILHGETFDEASRHALALAQESGFAVVHPFDDPLVIAGQGTLGLEILDAEGVPGTIYVPVGGGGLLSGIGTAVKEKHPDVEMVAVQAEGASSLQPSLAAGRPVACPQVRTIADGIAVSCMSDRTFEAVRRYTDDVVAVDDEEIAAAILYALEEMKTTLEGAGAAALAALLYKRPPKKFPAVMVLSGGNIDVNFLARITERGLFRSGRLIRLRFLVTDRPGSLAALLAAIARERSNVVSIEHDRLPADCPPGYSSVVLLLETRDRSHGEELALRLAGQGFRPTN